MATIAIPVLVSSKEDAPDFDKLADDMKKQTETGEVEANTFDFIKPGNQEKFEERLLGVFEDMYSLGYI